MAFFEAIIWWISPPICFEQRSVSYRFLPKKNKKATDKVALISERYLAGGLSYLLKASLVQLNRLYQSNLTWRWNYADKFHLNHSVGTPIQFSKQNKCSNLIIHTRTKIASAILRFLQRCRF